MHESEKWKWSRLVVSDPQRPHGLQPTRLLHPWDLPGKSTGVGCHWLGNSKCSYHALLHESDILGVSCPCNLPVILPLDHSKNKFSSILIVNEHLLIFFPLDFYPSLATFNCLSRIQNNSPHTVSWQHWSDLELETWYNWPSLTLTQILFSKHTLSGLKHRNVFSMLIIYTLILCKNHMHSNSLSLGWSELIILLSANPPLIFWNHV